MPVMPISTRYGLVGMAALALLTTVHWVRDQGLLLGSTGLWLVGVAPNFAAAVAITFVLLSFWADQKPGLALSALRLRFLGCAAISGSGLTGWELIQMTSNRFVFDLFDLLATFGGLLVAILLFHIVTPQKPAAT